MENEYLTRIAGILHSKTITRAEGEAIYREVRQHVDEKDRPLGEENGRTNANKVHA